MGLYDRDYMRDSDSSRSVPRIVLVLGVVVSLITASSYLMKEFRLFSKATAKIVSHEPSDHDKLQAAIPIDLNTATHEILLLLPQISDVRADAIINRRPFRTIEELRTIDGISESRLDEIRRFAEVKVATVPETDDAKKQDGD